MDYNGTIAQRPRQQPAAAAAAAGLFPMNQIVVKLVVARPGKVPALD